MDGRDARAAHRRGYFRRIAPRGLAAFGTVAAVFVVRLSASAASYVILGLVLAGALFGRAIAVELRARRWGVPWRVRATSRALAPVVATNLIGLATIAFSTFGLGCGPLPHPALVLGLLVGLFVVRRIAVERIADRPILILRRFGPRSVDRLSAWIAPVVHLYGPSVTLAEGNVRRWNPVIRAMWRLMNGSPRWAKGEPPLPLVHARDDGWRPWVKDLTREAMGVVVDLTERSGSLEWELEHLRARHAAKTILVCDERTTGARAEQLPFPIVVLGEDRPAFQAALARALTSIVQASPSLGGSAP